MKRIRFLIASLLACVLVSFGLGSSVAQAASLNVKFISFGVDNQVTDGEIQFQLEFSGGPADSASSCSKLIAALGYDLTLKYSVKGETDLATFDWFRIKDIAINPSSLKCEFSGNRVFTGWLPSEESSPITMIVGYQTVSMTSFTGVLLNPRFEGTLSIKTPTRGQEITGITNVTFSAYGGAGRKMTGLTVAVCKSECAYGNQPITLFPLENLGSSNGDVSDGFAVLSRDGLVKTYFNESGIYELELTAYFGDIKATNSVLVNVIKSARDTQLNWNDALDLILFSPESIGLKSSLDCGRSNLYWNTSRTCSATIATDSGYLGDAFLNTTVPVSIATSLNGGAFKVVKLMNLQTNKPTSFSLPVPKTGKSWTIRIQIDGYDDDSHYYSSHSVAYQSWGPAPTTVSMSVPSTIRWGQPFDIFITSNKTASGSCGVSVNSSSKIADVKISKGKGKSRAKMVWPAAIGTGRVFYLLAYCNIGGVKVSTDRVITGVR